MIIKKIYANLLQKLIDAGVESSSLDARLLIQHVLDMSHEEYILSSDRELSSDEVFLINELAQRRLSREPVAKIIGYKEFWGRCFKTTKDTLDPRPDSETLIECILKNVVDKSAFVAGRGDAIRILDLGAGTGCLLLTLLAELEGAVGFGVDASDAALSIAQENSDNLGLSQQAKFIKSNWLDVVEGKFDIIVSNPPYIPTEDIKSLEGEVRQYDPISALDGGSDGLDDYRKIISQAKKYLNLGGSIFLEIGQGQEVEIIPMLKNAGFQNIQTKKDLSGILRCIYAGA